MKGGGQGSLCPGRKVILVVGSTKGGSQGLNKGGRQK